MKKTTKSNPLKYFNDAAAARAKSVNAGNDKLVKAQFGKTVNPSDNLKKKMQQDAYNKTIKERDFKYNQQINKEAERRKADTPTIPTPTTIPYTPKPTSYKKGGAVNSKKK